MAEHFTTVAAFGKRYRRINLLNVGMMTERKAFHESPHDGCNLQVGFQRKLHSAKRSGPRDSRQPAHFRRDFIAETANGNSRLDFGMSFAGNPEVYCALVWIG